MQAGHEKLPWTAALPHPHSFLLTLPRTQVGIENLSVRFPQSNYSGHLQEDGYNWLVIGCVAVHGSAWVCMGVHGGCMEGACSCMGVLEHA